MASSGLAAIQSSIWLACSSTAVRRLPEVLQPVATDCLPVVAVRAVDHCGSVYIVEVVLSRSGEPSLASHACSIYSRYLDQGSIRLPNPNHLVNLEKAGVGHGYVNRSWVNSIMPDMRSDSQNVSAPIRGV